MLGGDDEPAFGNILKTPDFVIEADNDPQHGGLDGRPPRHELQRMAGRHQQHRRNDNQDQAGAGQKQHVEDQGSKPVHVGVPLMRFLLRGF